MDEHVRSVRIVKRELTKLVKRIADDKRKGMKDSESIHLYAKSVVEDLIFALEKSHGKHETVGVGSYRRKRC